MTGGLGQRHAILGPAGAGQAGFHAAQVHFQHAGITAGIQRGAKHALFFGVALDQAHPLRGAVAEAEIGERGLVNGRQRGGGAVLGRHIAERGAVGDREPGHALAKELHKFAHHAQLAQPLGDGKHQIGRVDAGREFAAQAHPDDFGQQHGDGLAQHRRLGFNAAHAPAQHAQAVDHGGMGVGADKSIGIGQQAAVDAGEHHHPGQIFQIDLVDDAGVGRHHAKALEGLLAPAQKDIAFAVALKFQPAVEGEGVGRGKAVHLHGMVNHQLDRLQRVDGAGIAAQGSHGVAHGGQIGDGGHAGKVLQQHAGGDEGNFLFRLAARLPSGQCGNVIGFDEAAVFVAQQVFEQDFQGVGQPRNRAHAGAFEHIKPEDFRRRSIVGIEARAGAKTVQHGMDSCVGMSISIMPQRPRRPPLRGLRSS